MKVFVSLPFICISVDSQYNLIVLVADWNIFLLWIKFKAYKHLGTFCYDTWLLCVFVAL